jgi:hypothetical protein
MQPREVCRAQRQAVVGAEQGEDTGSVPLNPETDEIWIQLLLVVSSKQQDEQGLGRGTETN